MTFSQHAWQANSAIYVKIKKHSFNVELLQGTLSQERFLYYMHLDRLYLQDFARCHALLAARCLPEQRMMFLRFAHESCVAEQELVHQFYLGKSSMPVSDKKTTALLSYTHYLLRMCALEPLEIAAAAVLPCFMLYQQLGSWMAKQVIDSSHPYFHWIDVYSSEAFLDSVKSMQQIVDNLAREVNAALFQSMLDAFYQSMCWEWHFWNDAYLLQQFDDYCPRALDRILP